MRGNGYITASLLKESGRNRPNRPDRPTLWETSRIPVACVWTVGGRLRTVGGRSVDGRNSNRPTLTRWNCRVSDGSDCLDGRAGPFLARGRSKVANPHGWLTEGRQ